MCVEYLQCHRLCAGTNCVHVLTLTECADSNFGRRRGNNTFLAADGIEPGAVWLRLTLEQRSRSTEPLNSGKETAAAGAGARDVIFPCRTPDWRFIFPTYFSLSAGEESDEQSCSFAAHTSRDCWDLGLSAWHVLLEPRRGAINQDTPSCATAAFPFRMHASNFCSPQPAQYSAARMSSSGPQNFPWQSNSAKLN